MDQQAGASRPEASMPDKPVPWLQLHSVAQPDGGLGFAVQLDGVTGAFLGAVSEPPAKVRRQWHCINHSTISRL